MKIILFMLVIIILSYRYLNRNYVICNGCGKLVNNHYVYCPYCHSSFYRGKYYESKDIIRRLSRNMFK